MQMNICLRDLPTRKKSRLPSRVPKHAYADCEISGQQPTQLYKEFPRVHEVGHSKKNAAHVVNRMQTKWAQNPGWWLGVNKHMIVDCANKFIREYNGWDVPGGL